MSRQSRQYTYTDHDYMLRLGYSQKVFELARKDNGAGSYVLTGPGRDKLAARIVQLLNEHGDNLSPEDFK